MVFFLLPYSGIGSGFLRARELDEKMEVVNDTKKKEVIVTFWRGNNQESVSVTEFGNGVTKKSNGAQDVVTELSNRSLQVFINFLREVVDDKEQ